jgi:hypothetical protein
MTSSQNQLTIPSFFHRDGGDGGDGGDGDETNEEEEAEEEEEEEDEDEDIDELTDVLKIENECVRDHIDKINESFHAVHARIGQFYKAIGTFTATQHAIGMKIDSGFSDLASIISRFVARSREIERDYNDLVDRVEQKQREETARRNSVRAVLNTMVLARYMERKSNTEKRASFAGRRQQIRREFVGLGQDESESNDESGSDGGPNVVIVGSMYRDIHKVRSDLQLYGHQDILTDAQVRELQVYVS